MSVSQYPDKKDSGCPWFGPIPRTWKLASLKQVVAPQRPITYGIVQAGPDSEGGVPYIRPADMSDENGVVSTDNILRTTAEIAESYRRSMIRTGDLVCSIGPSFGKVMITPPFLDGANLTQGTARVAISADHCHRYYFWVLRSLPSVSQWESSVGGATFRALNLAPLAATRILVPPLEEQQAIAAFLDRETSKIDALVAEQRRLIELLQEKRQAVISHAVTKGLDPGVRMKPSGIEWLGDVPEHWEVVQVRRLIKPGTSVTYGIVQAGPDIEGGIPYIRTSDMSGDVLPKNGYLRTSKDIDDAYKRSKVEPGDLVVAIRATLGKALLVPDYLAGANLTQGTAKISPGDRLSSEFLYWTFNAEYCQTSIREVAKGTTFLEITLGALRRICLVLPPPGEQKEIVSYLEERMRDLELLISEAQEAVILLQERRTALISAAVTGKIDVREVACQEV